MDQSMNLIRQLVRAINYTKLVKKIFQTITSIVNLILCRRCMILSCSCDSRWTRSMAVLKLFSLFCRRRDNDQMAVFFSPLHKSRSYFITPLKAHEMHIIERKAIDHIKIKLSKWTLSLMMRFVGLISKRKIRS